MQEENTFESIALFIRDKSREFRKLITRSTLLEDDLGITGDARAKVIPDFIKI